MTRKISNQELLQFKEKFDNTDTNDDGAIDASELCGLLDSLGITVENKEEIVKDMIEIAESDGNGEVDFPEFLAAVCRHRNQDETDWQEEAPEEVDEQEEAQEEVYEQEEAQEEVYEQEEAQEEVYEQEEAQEEVYEQEEAQEEMDEQEEAQEEVDEQYENREEESEEKKDLRMLFNEIDKNKDGKLSREELKSELKEKYNVSEEVCEELIRSSDSDNDGLINFKEFEKKIARFSS